MDLKNLIVDLPNLQEGGTKWIREFEDKTQGILLAIGDMKAILANILARDQMLKIMSRASPWLQIYTTRNHGVDFDVH